MVLFPGTFFRKLFSGTLSTRHGVHHEAFPVYGTTNVGCGTTNADAGVGIGSKRGFNNLIKKTIN